MGVTEQGIEGEQFLFKLLKSKGLSFFQPDAIGFKDNKYYLFEVKHQARFKAPPFDGHGLPIWQIKARLDFQDKTTIICVLVIWDSETNEIFYNRLDALEKGKYIDTHGLKPRRVYELTNFKMVKNR